MSILRELGDEGQDVRVGRHCDDAPLVRALDGGGERAHDALARLLHCDLRGNK